VCPHFFPPHLRYPLPLFFPGTPRMITLAPLPLNPIRPKPLSPPFFLHYRLFSSCSQTSPLRQPPLPSFSPNFCRALSITSYGYDPSVFLSAPFSSDFSDFLFVVLDSQLHSTQKCNAFFRARFPPLDAFFVIGSFFFESGGIPDLKRKDFSSYLLIHLRISAPQFPL